MSFKQKMEEEMIEVCGIDWSTAPERRFAVRLRVDSARRQMEVVEARGRLGDRDVHAICGDTMLDSVGVDVAFGWPDDFCRFVAAWRPGPEGEARAVSAPRFMFRETDRVVDEAGLGRPLSVSTNLLGRSAQAWTHQFLKEGGPSRAQIDVEGRLRGPSAGPPALLEVYPRAAFEALAGDARSGVALGVERYRRRDRECRQALIEGLERAVGLGGVDAAEFASNEHRVDALLAAVATALYACSCRRDVPDFDGWSVLRPSPEQVAAALREGWIFVPQRSGDAANRANGG